MKRIPHELTDEEEAEIQRQIAEDPDDFELSDEEMLTGRPFAEAHPDLYQSILRSRGRPRVPSPKRAVTIRLDDAVIEKFKATGERWRARMSEVLEKAKL